MDTTPIAPKGLENMSAQGQSAAPPWVGSLMQTQPWKGACNRQFTTANDREKRRRLHPSINQHRSIKAFVKTGSYLICDPKGWKPE